KPALSVATVRATPVAMLISLTCASGIGACEAVSVTVPERDPLETWAFRLTHKILENANRPTTRRIIELRYSDREKPIPGQEITFAREQIALAREQFAFARKQFAFAREQFAFARKQFAFPHEQFAFPRQQFAFPREQFAFPHEQIAFPREEMFIPD